MGPVCFVDKYMDKVNRSIGFDRVSDLVLSKPMTDSNLPHLFTVIPFPAAIDPMSALDKVSLEGSQ